MGAAAAETPVARLGQCEIDLIDLDAPAFGVEMAARRELRESDCGGASIFITPGLVSPPPVLLFPTPPPDHGPQGHARLGKRIVRDPSFVSKEVQCFLAVDRGDQLLQPLTLALERLQLLLPILRFHRGLPQPPDAGPQRPDSFAQ